MLPKALVVCLLDLLAVRSAFAWNHVSREQLRSAIDQNELTLVAFVAPWTEPSKALESEWLALASETQAALLSIDCTIESDLCRDYEILSYPAIRLFKGHGEIIRYRGPRKASAIAPYLHRAALPPVSILSAKNLTSFKTIDDTVFVAYISPSDKRLSSSVTTLASRNYDKYTFGMVTDPTLAQRDGIQVPSIVCYKLLEEQTEVLGGEGTGGLGLLEMEKFVERTTEPLIGEFNRRTEGHYLKAGKSLVYYFAKKEHQRENFKGEFTPLAKKYKEFLNFVTADTVENSHMLLALGLDAKSDEVVAVLNPMYGQVFPFTGKISAAAVEGFVMEIAEGKVQPSAGGGQNTEHTEL